MKILNQAEGMNTKTLIILLFAILLINACGKVDCDDSAKNLYVDKSYLPCIIPYSDTSTRLFLKNGKDTLLFKSQGLKESIEFYQESDINGYCRKYNMQKLSLTMAASDTDYFRINYYADMDGDSRIDFNVISGKRYLKTDYHSIYSYLKYFPTVEKIVVLKNSYDSINVSINSYNLRNYNIKDNVISRPNTGIIKVEMSNSIYELIK